jgi:heme o synthase
MSISKKFSRFAWVVLIVNVVVVLMGAFVRATGSGAGCGSHWPLCKGVVIPRAPQIETIIEFSHRLGSGVALIFVLILFIWAFKIFPKRHPVRFGVSLSIFFIITEALVGAALVLFKWVAYDASTGRVISIAVHLVNTFLLLASISLTAWWASEGKPIKVKGSGKRSWIFIPALLGVLLIGVTGAITALGDTLFPVTSLAEGLRENFINTGNFLIRLRIWHPVIAVLVALYIGFVSFWVWNTCQDHWVKRFSVILGGLFIIQICAGLINVLLLAPVWMQIIHLLLAESVWITLVLLTATLLASKDNEKGELLG